MAIKTLLTLEGAEDIKASLADLGKTGEDFVKKLNSLGNSNNPAIQKFVEDVKSASTATTEHGRSIDGLAKLYRLLNPVLKSAGVGLNEFRGFALAARFGIIGLGGAIVTGLVAGLIKLGDSTNETKKRLELMFDSADKGKASFEALKRAAEQFGTTTGSIGPTFEEFQRTLNNFQAQTRTSKFVAINPGDIPGIQNAETAFKSFFAILRAGGANEETANKAMIEFLGSIQAAGRRVADLKRELAKTTDFDAAEQLKKQISEAGLITGEFIEKIDRQAPGAFKLFEQALGKTGQSAADFIAELDRHPVALNRFLQGLARIEPATKQAFDTRPIKPFSESLSELRSSAVRDVQGIQESVNDLKKVPTDIGGVFSDLSTNGQQSFDSLKQIFSQNPLDTSTWTQDFFDFTQRIETKAKSTWDKIKEIFSAPLSLSFASEGVPVGGGEGFATGGLFRGRPGRDTNLAWLTDKEYILRPEATRYWGVGVLNALNAMRNPFKGFADGGLFRSISDSMSIPAFAGGGLNVAPSGLSLAPVHLHLPSGDTINLLADEDGANQVIRYGRKRGRASGGRPPSWVR